MTSSTPTPGQAREEILARVRRAVADREPLAHPGALTFSASLGAEAFRAQLEKAGGVVRRPDPGQDPAKWIQGVIEELSPDRSPTVAVGHGVAPHLVPDLPSAPPREASAGLSTAWAGASDSGTVILPASGGRRVQLLVPLHVVWLREDDLYPHLQGALHAVRQRGMGAAVALHSGPSKSADIGRTLVKGVHGPGTLVVALT